MIKFFKSNKTFTCCVLLTFFLFIAGIIFNSLIDDNTKGEITKNITKLISNFTRENYNLSLIFKTLFKNSLEVLIVWLFGISIIGVPIVLFFYSSKVFLFGFEFISLLSNLKLSNIFFVFVYLLPALLNIGIFFILIYYSINYSLVLFKILFMKRSYNLRDITRRYLKVLVIILLCSLVTALLESLVVPKVLSFII